MGKPHGPLFFVIIIYHEARMNYSWNPAEKRQDYTQEKTRESSGEQNGQRRENHTEKVTQRSHSFTN